MQISKKELERHLKHAFYQGCNAGYGIDVGSDLCEEEEKAWEEVKDVFKILKDKRRKSHVRN